MPPRVMTDARRFSEQTVVMLSPAMDDRIRRLAVRHGVSQGRAHRVALQIGLTAAERHATAGFLAVHAECERDAVPRHDTCLGLFHPEDSVI